MFREIYEHINWFPDRRHLRFFGWSAGGALFVIATVLGLHAGAFGTASRVLILMGLMLIALGCVAPQGLFGVYRVWMGVTAPLFFCFQTLLLILFFFAVLTPVALVLKVLRRDSLKRTFDRNAASYWVPRRAPPPSRRYFRQY